MGCKRQTQRQDRHGTKLLPHAWSLSLSSWRSSSLCSWQKGEGLEQTAWVGIAILALCKQASSCAAAPGRCSFLGVTFSRS